MVQGINTADIKEESRAGPVRTGYLGRLQSRPKVAKVAENDSAFPELGD